MRVEQLLGRSSWGHWSVVSEPGTVNTRKSINLESVRVKSVKKKGGGDYELIPLLGMRVGL